jgi:hypothetical protein
MSTGIQSTTRPAPHPSASTERVEEGKTRLGSEARRLPLVGIVRQHHHGRQVERSQHLQVIPQHM